jgi:tripartite-type tricarboxylate transporter receptor subunit TctC
MLLHRYAARLLSILVAAVSIASIPPQALAQSGRVIRIVVPFAPGGGQDILARSFNAELGTALGQSVIVENRAGAGGAIATLFVAKSEPDGQTLLMAAASHTINALLMTKPPYDPIRDFTAVAHVGSASYVLMTNASIPARTVAEFVQYAKANPGKLNYASAGNGSATHLSIAYFASLAGLDMVHVPYKSTGEAITEVIAGRSHALIVPTIGALAYQKDDRIRVLAATSPKRSPFVPNIPTVAESGIPGYQFDSWFGLLGPAGIPRPVVERMNTEMGKLLPNPVILERLAKQGIEPLALTPDGFDRLLRSDLERMAKLVKLSGARIE